MLRQICVYCGSHRGTDTAYADAAVYLGRLLAEQNITLVYGGGHVGLMGLIADSVLTGGGRVIGVIPQQLQESEVAHTGVTQLHIVANMHERKAMMAQQADAFIALPGGLGTLEELFEMLTWQQLGIHQKPIGLLNVAGYFDNLLAFLDTAVDSGYIKAADRQRLYVADSAPELLRQMGSGS